MSRHAQENVVSILLLALFAGVIILCQDFGPRARLIPLPLAVFGIVLTLIQLAWHNLGSTTELQIEMIAVQAAAGAEPAAPVPEQAPEPEKKPSWRQDASACAIVCSLVALVFLIGIIPAIFVFTAGYFLMSGYCSWWASLIYTAIFTATVYLLFVVALEMQSYHGLLAPLFE